uniref:sugar transferase n=1 Tax=Agathobacter sp. TaxID=2021311 RepID=UPI00405647AA
MYRRINTGWLKHWDFELVDLICIEIAFFIAYYLRHKEMLEDTVSWYAKLGVILLAVDIVVIFFSNNYKNIIQRKLSAEFWSVIRHVTVVELIFVTYEFIVKEVATLSRYVVLVSWGLSVILCLLGRLLVKSFVRSRITSESHQSKMLVITTKERVVNCMNQILSKRIRDYRVTCISMPSEDETKEEHKENLDIIYGDKNLWEYVRTHVVDEVFVDTFRTQEELNELVERLLTMGITVHIGMGFLPDELPNRFVEKIGAAHVLTTSIKAARTWEIAVKRAMDIVGGLVGLMLMGIAYVFVAPMIKKQSPGPIFFKQERVGRNGRTFYIYKFRSMYMDAEERKKELMKHNEMQGLMFKMENDPRIIGSEKGPGKGIGNFIRKTSIDELPQFWNILKGEMSLVGTRPPTVQEYEQYDLHHKIRLSIKPGLTGMWQVSGRSDITDFEEIVRLDTKYIKNWSLRLDVELILKTVLVVLRQEGSK